VAEDEELRAGARVAAAMPPVARPLAGVGALSESFLTVRLAAGVDDGVDEGVEAVDEEVTGAGGGMRAESPLTEPFNTAEGPPEEGIEEGKVIVGTTAGVCGVGVGAQDELLLDFPGELICSRGDPVTLSCSSLDLEALGGAEPKSSPPLSSAAVNFPCSTLGNSALIFSALTGSSLCRLR